MLATLEKFENQIIYFDQNNSSSNNLVQTENNQSYEQY